MTWKTVKKCKTYEEADRNRKEWVGLGFNVKVKKYGGSLTNPLRYEVKIKEKIK